MGNTNLLRTAIASILVCANALIATSPAAAQSSNPPQKAQKNTIQPMDFGPFKNVSAILPPNYRLPRPNQKFPYVPV
ncbi:MAG: hypothetical protein RML84_11445, partial [Anaerolineae bacterium]|nr:hypothetical protein [Anaerolineae bacterium]